MLLKIAPFYSAFTFCQSTKAYANSPDQCEAESFGKQLVRETSYLCYTASDNYSSLKLWSKVPIKSTEIGRLFVFLYGSSYKVNNLLLPSVKNFVPDFLLTNRKRRLQNIFYGTNKWCWGKNVKIISLDPKYNTNFTDQVILNWKWRNKLFGSCNILNCRWNPK